jgi:hypothetical protein
MDVKANLSHFHKIGFFKIINFFLQICLKVSKTADITLNFVFTKVDYHYQKSSEFMLILKPLRKMQKINLKIITRQYFGGESQRVLLGYEI